MMTAPTMGCVRKALFGAAFLALVMPVEGGCGGKVALDDGAATDAGDASRGSDAFVPATPPTDACGPGGRYTVLAPATECSSSGEGDGSGLVQDNTTSLVWTSTYYTLQRLQHAQAITYCSDKGMRLPTKAEALGVAARNWDRCAFPCGWTTWTSSLVGSGLAWGIDFNGHQDAYTVFRNYGVLCVR